MPKTKTASADSLVIIATVALSSFILALLYIGRDILVPMALATLLTFLLTPVVGRFERYIGRVAAVLLAVLLVFAATGAAGWIFTRQVIDLATKLPDYQVNIVTKLQSIRSPTGHRFDRLSQTLEDLKKEMPGSSKDPDTATVRQERGRPETAVISPPEPKPAPAVPVKVVETAEANPASLLEAFIAPVLGPLGTSALVLLLVIFMLLKREDLRSRLIRLIGQGRISATTRALDDAGSRVSRYLLMQLVVNVTYGIPVAVGLYFIGVPNAILWGGFATVLRFIPYVGPWIAASMPVALSLAVSPGWTMPMLTVGLFILLELFSNNVMEPWLYGASTGVSSMALIVAAVVWTWLWGPIGLVLATPLTVCLVVMGRHVPRLAFLSVLLSDEDALTPAEDCYHRLLTPGENDEIEFVDTYLRSHPLAELYDAVLVPVIAAAEGDARLGLLEPDQLQLLELSLRDIVEDLGTRPLVTPKKVEALDTDKLSHPVAPLLPCRIYCLPARSVRDELAGLMLAHLLRVQGSEAWCAPGTLVAGELLELVEKADADVVCISVIPPSTVIHARYLCLKLRARFPRLKIIVGLWGASDEIEASAGRLREAGANEVTTTLAETVERVARLVPSITDPIAPAPLPEDDAERLAALHALRLLDTGAEPVFDRITARLAHIFEVPVVLLSLVDRDRQFFKSQIGLPDDLAASLQTPRDVSICGHVVAGRTAIVVEDLARDRRFAQNPWFTQRGMRFYAGAPLLAPGGQPVGALCLLDRKPRVFSERDRRQLEAYAEDVMEEFARRAGRLGDTAPASA